MTIGEMLLWNLKLNWELNGAYGQQLIADLDDTQMVAQPRVNGELAVNHAAWVISHLCVYHPVIADLLAGRTPEDPKGHRYGMTSTPVGDTNAYADADGLRRQFSDGHASVAAALEAADERRLLATMPVDRWVPRFPTIGQALPYLMIRHEALHLGQLSAWRRVQGLPPTTAS
jgi:hypothetical protein